MSNAANRVVKNLDADIEEKEFFDVNKTPEISPAKFYDRVIISKDENTGRFSESIVREETEVKDNVIEDSELIQKAQLKIIDYTDLAKIVDFSILDNLNLINDKKQQIIDIGNTHCGICSCVQTTAAINGVVIGIGSYIQLDRVFISKYTNLNDFSSDEPFRYDNEFELNASTVGTGYKTNELEINYLTDDEQEAYDDNGIVPVGLGSYRSFNGLLANGITSSETCAGYATSISNLAAEIDALRQAITDSNSLRNKVNDIKDKKTEEEILLWALKHGRESMDELIDKDKSLLSTIKNEPIFGYINDSGSVTA